MSTAMSNTYICRVVVGQSNKFVHKPDRKGFPIRVSARSATLAKEYVIMTYLRDDRSGYKRRPYDEESRRYCALFPLQEGEIFKGVAASRAIPVDVNLRESGVAMLPGLEGVR